MNALKFVSNIEIVGLFAELSYSWLLTDAANLISSGVLERKEVEMTPLRDGMNLIAKEYR